MSSKWRCNDTTCKEKREHGQQAGKPQPRAVLLARKLSTDSESRRQTSCQETFHWEQRVRIEWPCFLSRGDPYVTRTMRDSVWTEGKPQSPPQHLSSMAAAMFDSSMEPVTSPGSRPIRSQGREGGHRGQGNKHSGFFAPNPLTLSFSHLFIKTRLEVTARRCKFLYSLYLCLVLWSNITKNTSTFNMFNVFDMTQFPSFYFWRIF